MIPSNILNKIEMIPEAGCWLWIGFTDRNGYSRMSRKGKGYFAHRFIYELFHGAIPGDKVIDHLCRVPCCVNPDHMEVVTQRVNTLRGIGPSAQNAQKTHCKNGHLLSGENVVMENYGGRRCRQCRNVNARKFNKLYYYRDKNEINVCLKSII